MDKATGSRAEVFHNNARHTSGGLTRNDLKTKEKRLEKAGYKTTKGEFKLFK